MRFFRYPTWLGVRAGRVTVILARKPWQAKLLFYKTPLRYRSVAFYPGKTLSGKFFLLIPK